MPLGFSHQRTVLPLLRGSSSYALSTLFNGHITQGTRIQVANASRFARRVNSGKLPTIKVPENAPQTVESWSNRASVPPQKDSWKTVIILLYLAGPCVRALQHPCREQTDARHFSLLCTPTLLLNPSDSMQRTGRSTRARE